MKKIKVLFILVGIIMIAVSLHLIGYMIRVVILLSPEVDFNLIAFFGVGAFGVLAGLISIIIARKLNKT